MIARIPGRRWREVILGPAYWRHKSLIVASRSWTPQQQSEYQQHKVRAVGSGYDLRVIRSKSHYRSNEAQYNRYCMWGLTKIMRTGGTTGTPFTFRMDTLFRRQKERAYLFDVWSTVGFEPFDLRVVFRGNIRAQLISYDLLENCYIISPSRLTVENRSEVVRFLKELPPFFLHVYPSSLFSFIDLVGEQEFRKLKIRGVLAGSESFPPAQIEHFRKRFGLKVAHWYGHGEYATLAFWCEECLGFHFYPTYGYTELVPTEDGRLRIVATSFNRIGTRFLRYDTGDIAYDDGQACRRPFLRVSAIEGREQEYFIGKDGLRRAFGPYLFGIHDSFWETIRAIQFRQSEKGAMRVAVAIKQGKDRDSLESYLRERFGTCDLEFDYVEEIPKTLSGKHRYYITSLQ